MVKIVKNPGNGRLNNLNDPVLNVLTILDILQCVLREWVAGRGRGLE